MRRIFPKSGRQAEPKTSETKMGKRKIVEAVDKQERIKRRKGLGKLADLVIQPPTATRYEKALKKFFGYLQQQKQHIGDSHLAVDQQLSNYLEFLWEEGEPLSLAGDTISAVQHHQPSLCKRLSGAWRLYKAWQQRELPARSPPFTIETLQVLLGWLHSKSPPVALAVFLAFRCLLRTGEMLAVTARDIVIPSNSCSGVLSLGDTKIAGRNPNAGMVNLTDPTLVFFAQSLEKYSIPSHSFDPLVVYKISRAI